MWTQNGGSVAEAADATVEDEDEDGRPEEEKEDEDERWLDPLQTPLELIPLPQVAVAQSSISYSDMMVKAQLISGNGLAATPCSSIRSATSSA